MRVRAALSLVAITAGVLTATLVPAAAQADSPQTVVNQTLYDDGGNPYAIGFVSWANNPPMPAWRACAPDCGAIIATDQSLKPGPTPAGTIFQAESTIDGVTTTARTTTWQGPLSVGAPPAVVGDLRVGQVVSAQGAAWSGGWGTADFHDLKLYACPTATSMSCVSLTIGYASTTASAAIHPAYAGWYLRAVDRDDGVNPSFTTEGRSFTPGLTATSPIPGASATVAVSDPVGPIPPAAPSVPHAVTGKLAVGSTITATAGTWPDAPAGSAIATGLRACPTSVDSRKCIALTRFGLPAGTATAKLEAGMLGWYVGTVDEHLWPYGTGLTPSQAEYKLPAAGPTVIYGPLSATPVGLGFTPRVVLRKHAVRQGANLVLGELRCAARCVAFFTIDRGKWSVTTGFKVTGKRRALTVRAKDLGPKPKAPIHVRVTFAYSTAKGAGTVLAPRVRPAG